jgi:hypothetical protein
MISQQDTIENLKKGTRKKFLKQSMSNILSNFCLLFKERKARG